MEQALGRVAIPVKIIAVLLLLGLVTLGVAFSGSRALSKVDSQYSELTDHRLPVTTLLARVNRLAVSMVYAGYRTMAYDGSSAQAKAAEAEEKTSYEKALGFLDQIETLDPSAKSDVAELRERMKTIHTATSKAVSHGMVNDNAGAALALQPVDAEIIALSKDIATINDGRIAEAKKLSDELSSSVASTSTSMLVISFLATLAGLGLGYCVARFGITGPINQMQETMRTLAAGNNAIDVPGLDRRDELAAMAQSVLVFRDNAVAMEAQQKAKAIADAEQKKIVDALEGNLGKLAEGDLTVSISVAVAPEYESVKQNFNTAVGALCDLIGTVAESANSISTGSVEIAQASEDLARRTEANAASLEETSAAVTEMDQRLKATAESAKRTVARADGAISTVQGGRSIADEAVQAMTRVADSAKGIDSVIEGLDKIAFQTRVLAMNAAVEAGRAGEAGRGFAVVADLVSALAMRAEEEAGRARDQLTATQTDIVAAVEMVQKVDGALANITGDVGEVHSLLGQMATDNQAQSTAISQISTAIGTMDQATQQNAAMVEETSAAARNLKAEVGSMTEQAARFNIGGNIRPAARSAAPARAASKPKTSGYVSPVKALPVAAMAAPSGDDWASF
ncbi:methyl-accepting chemotaxis protein [Sphingomonas sp. CJ20]